MRSDIVTIEPEIVQFGRENIQTIKIINNTSSPVANFFFCLYNTEKFSFSPDSFSLAPNEHKLVTISLRIKSGRSVAKQFAYLKSTEINKRITLLVNQFQSPDAKTRPEQGLQDINTLSSRDYKDVQTQAIEKIIREKEAYIALLEKERDHVNRSITFKTEESGEKTAIIRRQCDQLEMKLAISDNEKQSLLKENLLIQNKFEEYRKFCESDLKNYEKLALQYKDKTEQNTKLQQQVTYLQQQGTQFLQKIEQKEQKVRQLQQMNLQAIEAARKQTERKYVQLEERLQEQKNVQKQTTAFSEERIRDLERQLEDSRDIKQKTNFYEKELKKREEEIRNLMGAVDTERSSIKELEAERKKLLKLQMMNESMIQRNNELTSRLKQLQKVNHNLKEEVYVFKSKVSENDVSSDKMNQYLQIALQSCRSENQALKRSKQELQKSLDQFMTMNKQSHDNNKVLSEQVSKLKEEMILVTEIKDNLERRNEELKQENHLAVMQLKTENIELLQKLSMGETSKREDRIKLLEDELILKSREVLKLTGSLEEQTFKNEQLVIDNTKLCEKVKKYKKEAKKQLRSINETAISQLHKEHEEKKDMARRIAELEEVVLDYSCGKIRDEKGTRMKETNTRAKLVETDWDQKSRASSRAIGIKDQRREIIYSQGSNNEVYSELGQLREINNFVKNQEDKFNRLFNLEIIAQNDSEDKVEPRPIFRIIKFFKRLEDRLDYRKDQDYMSNVKEVEYMKGRIKELEGGKDDKENLSSINLSKTREHCSELLEYVREEMKSQYKKLNDTLKLSEQKHDLLKKKIYEEYRARIIEALNKKEKGSIAQLQTILERFIDGMSNLSHKEAVLHKEIKLKQNARKQNTELKQKVNQLNFLLQTKKGNCSRDPVKLIYNETELEWQESLKREAQFLTLTAEYQRIKEELELVSTELAESNQRNSSYERELDDKSNEVLKLKKYQIEIQSNYESEIQKQYEIIQENKRKVMESHKHKQPNKHSSKEKQYMHFKENFQKQKDIIKQLRDRERALEELLEESHRSQQKESRRINEDNRIAESMRDLKDNNRELRTQNGKMKEKITKLEEQLDKKAVYLKNLKGDLEDNRVRVQRKEEAEHSSLQQEYKLVADDLRKTKDELDKTKRKRDKDISDLKNEIDRLKNEKLITEKSLESIVRALMDTVRKLYSRLKRVIKRKRGREVEDQTRVFESSDSVHINAVKIDEAFEEVLVVLEEVCS